MLPTVSEIFNRRRRAARRLSRAPRSRLRPPAFELLEGRRVLAITGLPATAGDQLGGAIALGTDGAGPNLLTITLDEISQPGFVAAIITANTPTGSVTRTFWNFNDSISFTGTNDTSGSIVNTVSVTSPLGGDLTNGATKFDWKNVLDWTPSGLNDVTVSLKYADSLTLQSAAATGAAPINLAGTFNSPTLAPSAATGAAISVASNSPIKVLAAGVQTYNLSLASTANGAAAGIDLQGTVTTVNDVNLTSFNDLPIIQPVSAGGKVTIATTNAAGPGGNVAVSAAVTAAGDLKITAAQGLTTSVGGTLQSTAATISATATVGNAAFGATVTAANGITLVGSEGVSTAAAAALSTTTGNVSLTSVSGTVATAGTVTATAGSVAFTASALAVSTANKVTALSGVTLNGATGVTIGDDVTVTGAGNVSAKATSGNLLLIAASPVTVVDGTVTFETPAGRMDVNSLVQANNAVKMAAAQGFAVDDTVDPTAAIRSTGLAGSVEIASETQQVLIKAPVFATAGTGTIKITSSNNDVVIRDGLQAGGNVTVSGKTTVDANGAGAVITLSSLTGTVALTSTAADVTLGTDLAFVAGPGAAAALAFTAATKVAVPIALAVQGNVAIVSPDGFTLQQAITSALGTVSVTTGNGALAVTAAPITAGGTITLSSLNQLDVGSVLTSTGGGISLASTGGAVNVQATAGLVVADATAGILGVTAATTLTQDIDLVAGNNINVASGAGFTPTKNFTSTNGSVSITSSTGDLNVSGSTISAAAGATGVTLAAPSGKVAVDVTKVAVNLVNGSFSLTAGGLITVTPAANPIVAGGDITISSTAAAFAPIVGADLKSNSGSIKIQMAGTLDVTNVKVEAPKGGIDLKSTGGDVVIGTKAFAVDTAPATATGRIVLTADAGTVTIGQNLTAGNAITIASSQTFTATQALTSTGGAVSVTSSTGNVTTTGQTIIASDVITLTATVGNVAAGILTSTKATTITSGGTTTLNGAVAGGTGVTVTSTGTATLGAAVTALTGNLTITSTGGDVDASAAAAVLSAPSGKIELSAAVGQVILNAANPLAAPGGIALLAGADLTIPAALSSTAGGITLSSTGGDVIVNKSLTAAGVITITAHNEVKSAAGAIAERVQANSLVVTAGYGAAGTAPVQFTNVSNDVDTLSITLATGVGMPIGTGITYVDANSVTVIAAVTATGTVDIRSVGGLLTLAASLGALFGESLSGVALRAKDAVTVAGSISVNVAGNAAITSDDNGVSITGAVSAASGNITVNATGAIAVAGSGGITVTGPGDISCKSTASNISIAGPITANTGIVSLNAGGGTNGVAINGAVFATGDITIAGASGVAVTQTGIAVQSTGGNVILTSANGGVSATGDIVTSVGDVTITALNGVVNLSGGVNAGVGGNDDVTLTAGPLLFVVGTVFAGGNCTFAAAADVNLGPTTGAPSAVTANSGSVSVTSTNGPVVVNSNITAATGAITVSTAGTVTFTGGTLTVLPTYVAGPPATGLVSITGTLGITANTNPVIQAGRLEVVSSGGGNIAFTNANNQVSTLQAVTAGNFTFVNAIPLALTDFDGLAPSVQVGAQNVDITSPQGLRVIDGIKYTGTLTLTASSASRGVEFVPSSTGDNAAAGAAFAGTLRDMVGYVNANAASNQTMSIVFDESGTTLATTTGEISLTASLPNLVKPILFDGVLPTGGVNVGGNVGIRGNGVPAIAAANGLTLGTGSSKSTIRNAYFSEFAGAGISVRSSDNLLSGLVIGAQRTGAAGANGVGIDLFGTTAARNTIGIGTVGDSPNEIVNNTTAGVRIRTGANYNLLYGNFIGVTQVGAVAGNMGDGVSVQSSIGTVIGATTAVLGNTISNNGGNGVRLTDVSAPLLPYGAQVIGNTIANNTAAGVRIEGGAKNLVGGTTPPAKNTISGNQDGVVLAASGASVTRGNTIVGNDITGSTRHGAFIDLAYGNTIDGNTVSNSGTTGIRVARAVASRTQAANQVVRNTVTGNGDGNAATGGIVLDGAGGQMVGRLTAASNAAYGNLVTGNVGSGIVILGGSNPGLASLNAVENNLVGVTAGGAAAANTQDGIRVVGGVTNTIRGNTVRHNLQNGISLVDAQAATAVAGNVVAGNTIGNNGVGVYIGGGKNNLIGGTLASAGNRIFSSGAEGVVVESTPGTGSPTATLIRNNVIGRDANSMAAGNTQAGIRLTNTVGTVIDYANTVANNTVHGITIQGGRDNVVGSAIASRGNLIDTNTGDGIQINQPAAAPSLTQAVMVAGNVIQSNTGFGVNVVGSRSSGVTIGRTPSISQPTGAENTIRGNVTGGVKVDAAVSVTIVGNQIVNNGTALTDQIKLANNGNANVVAPTLTAASKRVSGQAAPQYDISGTVTGPVGQRFFVDFYGIRTADGRQFFLGRVSVTVRGTGTGSFRAIVGSLASKLGNGSVDQIVATATPASSLNGGTSAFSVARNV